MMRSSRRSRTRTVIPPSLVFRPIDDRARSGGSLLVLGEGQFACVAWRDGAWRFGNDAPLDFEPTHFHLPEDLPGPQTSRS